MGLLTQRMILFDRLNSVPLQAAYDVQLKSLTPTKIPKKSSLVTAAESDSSGNQSDNGNSFTDSFINNNSLLMVH